MGMGMGRMNGRHLPGMMMGSMAQGMQLIGSVENESDSLPECAS